VKFGAPVRFGRSLSAAEVAEELQRRLQEM